MSLEPMKLTPENALLLLTGPPSRLRDQLRRDFIRRMNDDEVMYWLGALFETFLDRHPRHLEQMVLLLREIEATKRAANQAATS